jgi:predicted GIY-YIG superfamily endonuclease
MIVIEPENTKSATIPFTKGHVVYFLLQGDYVAYVGQTTHLVARVAQHVVDGKQFDYISYIEVDSRQAMLIEALNIQYHNPSMNVYIPKEQDIVKMKKRLAERSS